MLPAGIELVLECGLYLIKQIVIIRFKILEGYRLHKGPFDRAYNSFTGKVVSV